MRRKIKAVSIQVSSNFYNLLEARRIALQKKVGFRRNISQPQLTEMLIRSGKLNLPKLNIDVIKNVKK